MESMLKDRLMLQNCRVCQAHPEADRKVLDFITELCTHMAADEDAYEVIRGTFHAGYCWHFAHLLKATFSRGEVCWAAPFGHFVWVDDNGVPYDVEGLNMGEQDYNIPERYLGGLIKDFTRIPGEACPCANKEQIIGVIRRYEDDNNLSHKDICFL